MIRSLICFLVIVYFPNALAGAEHSSSEQVRILKEIKLEENKKAYIVVREAGHLLGQPYQVELRVQCDENKTKVLNLPVKDSYSVCDLKPESLKINLEKTALAMKVKTADLINYYDQVDRGIFNPKVRCQRQTSIEKFSLRKLCN